MSGILAHVDVKEITKEEKEETGEERDIIIVGEKYSNLLKLTQHNK